MKKDDGRQAARPLGEGMAKACPAPRKGGKKTWAVVRPLSLGL